MLRSLTLFFFAMIWFVTGSYCQLSKWERLYTVADSLATYDNFNLAHELLDSILTGITKETGNTIKLELQAKSLKGDCFEKQNKMSNSMIYTLEVVDRGNEMGYYSLVAFNYNQIALLYEKLGDLDKCFEHLIIARDYINKHSVDSLLPMLYVRFSSYYNFTDENDSLLKYAKLALVEAEKYDGQDLTDAFLLLASYYYYTDPNLYLEYTYKAKTRFLKQKKYNGVSWMYFNISSFYVNNNQLDKAIAYSDSSLIFSRKSEIPTGARLYKRKALIYEKLGKFDSANQYLKLYSSSFAEEIGEQQALAIKEVKERYKSQRKDEIITEEKQKNRTQYNILLGSIVFLILIGITSFFLFRTNKKLKESGKLISKKTEELNKSLEQKELLLAEIHHRVKNNLQTIVGILGLQTVSAKNKTLDEITIETQDRVKSMATLHNKVYEENGKLIIDFDDFLQEITQSLIESHSTEEKEIIFDVSAEFIKFSIDQSIPMGLIIVELVNNSFKYAFKERDQGLIKVNVTRLINQNKEYMMTYEDNGVGIEEDQESNGMGYEIIHGLVAQLKGEIVYTNNIGIFVTIKF